MIAFISQTLFLALVAFALGWLSGRFIKGLFCQLPSKTGYFADNKKLLKTHNNTNDPHSTPDSSNTNKVAAVSAVAATVASATVIAKSTSNSEDTKKDKPSSTDASLAIQEKTITTESQDNIALEANDKDKGFDEVANIISGVSPILTTETSADTVAPNSAENNEDIIKETQKAVTETESLKADKAKTSKIIEIADSETLEEVFTEKLAEINSIEENEKLEEKFTAKLNEISNTEVNEKLEEKFTEKLDQLNENDSSLLNIATPAMSTAVATSAGASIVAKIDPEPPADKENTTKDSNDSINASEIDRSEKAKETPQAIAAKNIHSANSQATIFRRRNMRRFKSYRR